MNFYIKEWPDDTATLMTEGGRVVWTFASVEEAEAAVQNGDEIMQPKDGISETTNRSARRGAKDRSWRSAGRGGIVA